MLRFDLIGGERAARHLDLLRLTPSKRRTVLRSLGRIVRKNARQRIKTQTTVDGGAMQARSPNSKKRGPMLNGLARRMIVKTDINTAVVRWRGGRVAHKQQTGESEKMTPEKMRQRESTETLARSDPCSRRQARRLRELGYKIRRGHGWKQPSLKWIQANLKMGQARLLIRELSGEQPKTEWNTGVPARPFLGVTASENREMRNAIVDVLSDLA